MSEQTSGWPGAYGVPLNPDANGWHALTFPNGMTGFFPWDGATKTWWIIDREASADQFILGILYCGPAKNPAQVAAAEGAAAWEMLDRCVAACEAERNEQQAASHASSGTPQTAHVLAAAGAEICRAAVRALSIPAPGALERAVAKSAGAAREAALKDAAAHLLRAFPPSAEREAAVSLFQQIGEEAAIRTAAGVPS